jgi:hypothetical protein
MIQNLSNTLFRKITSHWLVLPAIFFCYLLWNTGLHGDDYAEIFRLKNFTLYNFYFGSIEDFGVFLFGLPIYFSLYWTFPVLGMDYLYLYDFIKVIVHLVSLYCTFIFFNDYLHKDRAILAACLFILFPLHDSANYWYMALSYILVPSILMLAHHFIREQKYFLGFCVSFLGSFAFYASIPIVFGLGCIFLLQQNFKAFIVYVAPGFIYVAYYLIMKMRVDGLEVKINNDLSISGYLQDLILQFLTMIEASIGPSAFIKIFYSLSSISLLGIGILFISIFSLNYHLKTNQLSSSQSINPSLIFGLSGILFLSMVIYAMTSAYWHTPFNLSNRSLIYPSLLISYLLASLIPSNKQLLLFTGIIFLASNLGLSDHWKDWNHKQKIVIERVNNNSIIQASENATFFVSKNLYSKLGPYSYIEFFSMPWNVRAIFQEDQDTNFIAITPYLKISKSRALDLKSNIKHPIHKTTYYFDSSSGILKKVSLEELKGLIEETETIHRHWIQFFKGTIIERVVIKLAPSLSYLFA